MSPEASEEQVYAEYWTEPWTRSALGSLFDDQLNAVIENDYPQAAGISVAQFRECIQPLKRLVERYRPTGSGGIPFLIVVPERFVPIPKQLQALQTSNISLLRLTAILPVPGVHVPDNPYLALTITDGRDFRSQTPVSCIQKLRRQKRSPLTLCEGIALVTHFPCVLRHHAIDLFNSVYGATNVPTLSLIEGRVFIGGRNRVKLNARHGTPSCGRRVI